MLDTYLTLFEQDYFQLAKALKGLADENVWSRPAEGLLSIGELAGHIAYWEAVNLAGEGEGLEKGRLSSPLVDRRFSYYDTTIRTAPSVLHLSMTAEQVHKELVRVHEDSLACFRSLNPDLESTPPGWPDRYNYRTLLDYQVFHVAYHTGQIYIARHLLGDRTPDN